MDTTTPRSLSDDALLESLASVLRDSRRTEASLLEHIAEVDRRELYLREACSSMFGYCVQRLRLSEPETALRIQAARACRRHPVLLDALRDGRLHLSGIAVLAPHLTDGNAADVLGRAQHRTKAQLQELVAQLAPRPDAPTVIRQIPRSRAVTTFAMAEGAQVSNSTATPASGAAPGATLAAADGSQAASGAAPGAALGTAGSSQAGSSTATPASGAAPGAALAGSAEHRLDDVVRPAADPRIEPRPQPPGAPAPNGIARGKVAHGSVEALSPARYRFQFTGTASLKQKLERLQILMLGLAPAADLGAVIEAAVTEKIERLEVKRLAETKAPRRTVEESDIRPGPRHIPAAVKRAVRRRDGDRCGYVDRQGRRCSERRHLQFHHRHPHGLGGDRSPGNISLRCRWHNRYEAEQDYGWRFESVRAGSVAAAPAATGP